MQKWTNYSSADAIDKSLRLYTQDTNVLKGIALLLLLCHHLFEPVRVYDDFQIGSYWVVQNFGFWSKVCVAIFVILSGYGLTLSSDKNEGIGNVWRFYKKRYLKLMLNYWFIYILFVPFGVFVIGRTFTDIYHGDWLRPILDFFGLHYVVTGDAFGYNATWWFYGCIIMLYLIYPLLYKYLPKWWYIVPLCLILSIYGGRMPLLRACNLYLPTFVAGMYMARIKIAPPIWIYRRYMPIVLVLCVSIVCLLRFKVSHTALWDMIIASTIILTYMLIGIPDCLKVVFSFIGKHSFNIFLFHTFILSYYFPEYTYWSTNPIVIFLTLFSTCILVSIILEYMKEKIGLYRLQRNL